MVSGYVYMLAAPGFALVLAQPVDPMVTGAGVIG
jgi:hypothetical protein